MGGILNGNYTFFYGTVSVNHHKRTGFYVHITNISATKRVEFVSDRISCNKLKGLWCDILHTKHASTDNKDDDIKESFHKELEQVSEQFPRFHVKILLRNFNA
jgi:hypothetical protein